MRFAFILLFLAFFNYFTYSDESSNTLVDEITTSSRSNINLVVAIDVSKSMLKSFKALQDYTDQTIIDKVLIDKDYFDCFSFGQYIKQRIEKNVSIPDDIEMLKSGIRNIVPDEDFTDIGLALETLDDMITQKKLPYERTIVFFITDGKNAPPKTSKYYGIDIFETGAFKFYSEVKSGDFKVMLLSIGSDTAASDLSAVLGGEFIEVSSNLSIDDLNEKIRDFTGSIEMSAKLLEETKPLKEGEAYENAVLLTFLSSYAENKNVVINNLDITIDDVDTKSESFPESFDLEPNGKKDLEIKFRIPGDLPDGVHEVKVEIKTKNNIVTKSLQIINFEKIHAEQKQPTAIDFKLDMDSKTAMIIGIIIVIMLVVTGLYLLYMLSIVSVRKRK